MEQQEEMMLGHTIKFIAILSMVMMSYDLMSLGCSISSLIVIIIVLKEVVLMPIIWTPNELGQSWLAKA